MAHLVFIHGINNQRHYPSAIANNWWNHLVEGWQEYRFGEIPTRPKITVGYYAQRLYAAAHGEVFLKYDPNNELPDFDPEKVMAQGGESSEASGDGVGLLQEYAAHYNEEIPREEVAAQGFIKRNLIKLADWFENRLDTDISKNLARNFLGQAAVYCDAEGLRNGIQEQVMRLVSGVTDPLELVEDLGTEPIILVTHSLGTVVGYRMLFEDVAQKTDIPLFVTLGSPLSLEFIKKSLDEKPLTMPENVGAWVNGHNREDVVTLGNSLAEKEIGFPGISNFDIDAYQPEEGPHDIRPHLKTKAISKAIYDALMA